MFANARMGRGVDAAQAAGIVEQIAMSLERNQSALISLARLKTLDSYTYLHSIAVSALMVRLGRHLLLDADAIRLIGMAGLLHDVGKMSILRSLLLKPGRLTPEEETVIRTHPRAGYGMLSARSGMPDTVLDVCLHHHERMDGTGYPDGLGDQQLSSSVRIAAICDIYDAVTSIRPYRTAWSPVYSLAWMLEWTGHFHEEILRSFIVCLGFEGQLPSLQDATDEPSDGVQRINGFSDPSAK